MTAKALLAVLCSALLLYAPVAAQADPAAMGKINTKGPTAVNGLAVPAEASLFTGDRIVTEKDASASVVLVTGGRLLVAGSSSVVLRDGPNQLTAALDRGAVGVFSRGDKPVTTEAAGTRIHAAQPGGFYEVAVNGNAVRVVAVKGAATVEGANRTVEVAEGKTLDATMAPAPPDVAAGLSTFEKAVIFLSAGAGLTGLGLGIAAIERAKPEDCTVVSPSNTISCK